MFVWLPDPYENPYGSPDLYLRAVRQFEIPGNIGEQYAKKYDKQPEQLTSVYGFAGDEPACNHRNNRIDVGVCANQGCRPYRKQPDVGEVSDDRTEEDQEG